jgi:uncharacterized protein YkwD
MKLFSFILAITLGISANAQPTSAEIVKEINRFRASQGLTAAIINPNHNKAAQLQADWIAQTGNYSHVQTRPLPGKPLLKNPWDRGDQVGASVVAENLFLVPISDGAAEIVAGWIASPGHRANLLYRVPAEIECRLGVAIAVMKSNPNQIIVVMVIGDNVDHKTGEIRN